ncbi:hypothetical protein QF026_005632 [Streptomyces aurantiacus]|uniref:hypothetical protein n=1 Tax=Streptomyces aurantiacus TaxID=47760 RepID=UPI00278FDDA7|nr:hypothetical protein [Streptomyces aurantiacus]MDQ0777166.1 hypothetical protein [Streptomyces aurantiacus]
MFDALDVDAGDYPRHIVGLRTRRAGMTLSRPGEEFAARLDVTSILVPGTHESLPARPEELAEALLSA